MAPTFRPAPMQEPVDEEAAPKRTGGERKPSSRPRTRGSLKPQIAAMLMTMNLALLVIPPLRQDILDAVEIEALARALDEQAKQDARFRKMLESALAMGSGGTLIGVCAIIGVRRAARHGILPPETDRELGNALAMGLSQQPSAA